MGKAEQEWERKGEIKGGERGREVAMGILLQTTTIDYITQYLGSKTILAVPSIYPSVYCVRYCSTKFSMLYDL
jgi:hypothetical protein